MPNTFTSALLFVMLQPPQGGLPVPIKLDPIAVAWADCQRLPEHQRPFVRYCWLNPNLETTLKDRQEMWQELSMACWRVSREQAIQVAAVSPVDKDFMVFRIDTFQLGWHERREETLERLVDPYMTYPLAFQGKDGKEAKGDGVVDTEEKIPAGRDKDGAQLYEREYNDKGQIVYKTRKVKATAKQLKEALAPWWNPETTRLLAEATQSRMPMMRADWFFNQISTDADKLIGYSAFLGVKDEKDFDKLVGRFPDDLRKTFPKQYVEAGAKVDGKSPTHHPRLIEAEMAAGGPYWRTADNRLPQGRSNPFKTIKLKDGDFLFEGRESLGHLPNGLLAAGAFAGNLDFNVDVLKKKAEKDRVIQGTRADVAPDFLASDRFAPDTDRRIHVGMSCWRCHADGIHDVVGYFRTNTQPPNALQFTDPKEQKEFTRLYQSDLESQINLSRQIYANAVMQATTMTGVDPMTGQQVVIVKGLNTNQESSLIANKWRKYENAKVDLNYAAADLMMTPGQAVTALKNIKTLTGQLDPVLDNFISGNLNLTIRQWEEYHGLAKLASMGIAPQ